MKPQNHRERRRAFVNFLVLFLFTTAVISACIFYSFQVPLKENEKLRNELATVDQHQHTTMLFLERMDRTIRLLDSVNLAGVQAALIDGDIDENLKVMKSIVHSDSTMQLKTLYSNVIENCYDLQHAKKQLREVSGKDVAFGNLQKENADLHTRLQMANNDLQSCQILLTNQIKTR
ncbi:hypothetical protein EXU57_06235 [Segetibacter sp. 3557_3]|uniref:type VI secretion system TssO n=1 Tax=Segetibacter sp. 3557_3 TaxID=2547429 RepID=UPI001058E83D|nr:type VI secretion system TssO [Segetibacter sp. 3557_3]TDH28058.1 hypothetical protein EXU57_06235 [Segetibacter sp. 3557_3]